MVETLKMISRRLTQTKIIHRRGAEVAENSLFCLSGDDDKQKHISIEACSLLLNRRLPIGYKF